MRPIKFRAKYWENDKWVYGGGVETYHDDLLMLSKDDKGLLVIHRVNPKTVGQFTGLHDCDGVDIYEGDILQDDEDTYKVIWWEEMATFQIENIESGMDDYFEFDNNKSMEIVGNIYDNPEKIEE